MMRVLYVTTTYPPDNGWGGIGTYVWHMARTATLRGHEVTILCAYGKKGAYEAVQDGMYVMRCLAEGGEPASYLREVGDRVASVVRARDIDVVEFSEYGALGLYFQRQMPEFPTVVRYHGCSRLCSTADPWWKRALPRACRPVLWAMDESERESVERAHCVTSCAKWLIDTYAATSWVKRRDAVAVLNPYVLPSAIGGELQSSPMDILFFGRLDRRKGADLLPAVAREVWRECPAARFVVAGQDMPRAIRGNWSAWVKSSIPAEKQDNMVLLGGVPHAETAALLAKHKVAFFASTWEAMPYSHIEAMAAGIACVVGSGGGAAELGEHDVHLLRTTRHAEPIADRLVELLRDDDRRRRIGIAAVRTVSERFGPESVGKAMEEVYMRAIQTARCGKVYHG